jgi:hypothetical protein
MEKLLNSKQTGQSDDKKQKSDPYKIKNFRLGSFASQSESQLNITPDGLEFKIQGNFLICILVDIGNKF